MDEQTDSGGSEPWPITAALLLINRPWEGRAMGRQVARVSRGPADHSEAEMEHPGCGEAGSVEGAETGTCSPDVLLLGQTSTRNTQKRDSQMRRAGWGQKESRRPSWRKGCKTILPAQSDSKCTHYPEAEALCSPPNSRTSGIESPSGWLSF